MLKVTDSSGQTSKSKVSVIVRPGKNEAPKAVAGSDKVCIACIEFYCNAINCIVLPCIVFYCIILHGIILCSYVLRFFIVLCFVVSY